MSDQKTRRDPARKGTLVGSSTIRPAGGVFEGWEGLRRGVASGEGEGRSWFLIGIHERKPLRRSKSAKTDSRNIRKEKVSPWSLALSALTHSTFEQAEQGDKHARHAWDRVQLKARSRRVWSPPKEYREGEEGATKGPSRPLFGLVLIRDLRDQEKKRRTGDTVYFMTSSGMDLHRCRKCTMKSGRVCCEKKKRKGAVSKPFSRHPGTCQGRREQPRWGW